MSRLMHSNKSGLRFQWLNSKTKELLGPKRTVWTKGSWLNTAWFVQMRMSDVPTHTTCSSAPFACLFGGRIAVLVLVSVVHTGGGRCGHSSERSAVGGRSGPYSPMSLCFTMLVHGEGPMFYCSRPSRKLTSNEVEIVQKDNVMYIRVQPDHKTGMNQFRRNLLDC